MQWQLEGTLLVSISKHKRFHETYLVTLPVEARLAHITSYVPKCPILTTMKLSSFFSTVSRSVSYLHRLHSCVSVSGHGGDVINMVTY
jgi:hypothetical protein